MQEQLHDIFTSYDLIKKEIDDCYTFHDHISKSLLKLMFTYRDSHGDTAYSYSAPNTLPTPPTAKPLDANDETLPLNISQYSVLDLEDLEYEAYTGALDESEQHLSNNPSQESVNEEGSIPPPPPPPFNEKKEKKNGKKTRQERIEENKRKKEKKEEKKEKVYVLFY